MQADINIIAKSSSPALEYTLKFIFQDYLGLTYKVCQNEAELTIKSGIIGYGLAVDEGINLASNDYLLREDLLVYPELKETYWEGLPAFFGLKEGAIPFDMFAAIFFLLARVEEYGNFTPDKHGRFSLKESILSNSGILKRPIIDEWIMSFETILKHKFPSLKPKKRQFKWINTFDIDVAFAYKNRPLSRVLGGTIKDILNTDWNRVKERFRVLAEGQQDAFDTYDYQKISSKIADEVHHFFLVGGKSEFDNNLSLENRGMQALLSKISEFSEVGLHPSYETRDHEEVLQAEKKCLEQKLCKAVLSSRQHFLRIKIPETYRALESLGITRDYSMGFAEYIGFRSGTSQKHLFFDVIQKKALSIEVVPLHAMDGALRDYMGLQPENAISVLIELIDSIYKVKGTFVSLWHNDLLSEDIENPWKEVYEKMVAHISDLKTST